MTSRWTKQALLAHLAQDHGPAIPAPNPSMAALRQLHEAHHDGQAHSPDDRRPISGWVMLPVHVTVAYKDDKPQVVQADIFYDYARPARDDFDDDHGLFEPARQKEEPNGLYYEGIDPTEGVPRVSDDEKVWWQGVALDDLERHLEDLWDDEA